MKPIQYRKRLKEISKTTDTILKFIVLAGGVVCLVVLYFLAKIKGVEETTIGIAIHIVSTIISGLFIFFVWDSLKKIIESEMQSKLIEDVLEGINGIRKVTQEEGFIKATNHLEKLNKGNKREIRVIGTSKPPTLKFINDYYEKTLSLFDKEERVRYRRITSYYLNDELKCHIESILKSKSNTLHKHDVEIMFIRNLMQTHNYLIVGDTFLLIILNYFNKNKELETISFCTENDEIIDSFTTHFENLWQNMNEYEKVAKNIDSFTDIFTYDFLVEKSFREIKDSLHHIGSGSRLLRTYVLGQISSNDKFYKELADGDHNITHEHKQNELLQTFCTYLDLIDSKYVFKAISFYQFWIHLLETKNPEYDFIKSNQSALEKGAKLNRILIIESSILDDKIADEAIILEDGITKKKYNKGISEILKMNIDNFCKDKKNYSYNFRILFTDEHKSMHKDFINFALIERKENGILKEAVLFEAYYRAYDDITNSIYYSNEMDGLFKKNKRALDKNQGVIVNKEKEFTRIFETKWAGQTIEKANIDFLEGVCPDYFNCRENFKKHLNLDEKKCNALGI